MSEPSSKKNIPWPSTEIKTEGQVAEYLVLSKATISRMAVLGQIPHMVLKSGRRKKVVRFRRQDIENWLKAKAHHARQRSQGGPSNQGKRKDREFDNGMATQKEPYAQVGEMQAENMETH